MSLYRVALVDQYATVYGCPCKSVCHTVLREWMRRTDKYPQNAPAVRIFNAHGETTDAREALALNHRLQNIDIYSNSWTTSDQVLYDGPDKVTQKVLENGVKQGRKRKGSIYLFPSGNGGKNENCNSDGYAKSIYTITISCALINGSRPHYSEICPCALATTLSEGGSDPFSYLYETHIAVNLKGYYNSHAHERPSGEFVVTCNRTNNGRCSTVFQGSSVSTALASGFVALALGANLFLVMFDCKIKSSVYLFM
ncbi:hypothetical protein CHS0354_033926 [Potamilus streckersoni]|uniref:Peptidase S8/S53 domain-containing protein n=1 Tax=Potamilus streckersoni TaxID=2493646 RepID=A0AAE0VKN9_9BIVA|nr:hypothetical protein CHS0354_033926 [Potamilus streckersoni]